MADGPRPDIAAVTFADIEAAARRIAGRVICTPLVHSRTLSDITGAEVWLKLENQQFAASFKERGAANKLLTLSPMKRSAASSPCPPATTPRASPITPIASGSLRPS